MINQLTIFVSGFLAIVTFIIPARYFLVPFILTACFIPTDQRIIIAGLDFTVLRILVVAGVLRILVRGERKGINWNVFDKLLVGWAVCGAVVYVFQWGDTRALVNRCGYLFDAIGLYWLFRQKVRNWDDMKSAVKLLALSVLLLAPLVALEWSTGSNPFEVLGKVTTITRGERYRCQAAFPHAIMLGLFWATLVPLFISLAKTERQKYLYWAAISAAVFIICATTSSTPIVVMLQVLLLAGLFRYRIYGRAMVYCICGMVFALHMVMNNPVWHLVTYFNVVGGSTGWHRFILIDKAIENFNQWALAGMRDTSGWGWGLGDITNQYILEGVEGGVITLILFVILLIMAVKTVGKYSLHSLPVKQQWFAWCLCVSVLGHCFSFIGVSYFGQILMLLYLTFAMVGLIYEMSHEVVINKKTASLLIPSV